MDTNRLIALLLILVSLNATAWGQTDKETDQAPDRPFRHMIGLHVPVSFAIATTHADFKVPFAQVNYNRTSGAPNSSIGLHYFYKFPDVWMIGARLTWRHFNTGGEMKIGSSSCAAYDALFCLRSNLGSEKFAVPIELSGGPSFINKMALNPAFLDYSSPYDAHIWFRGVVTNLKLGFQFGNPAKGFRFQWGLQIGSLSYKAHRFEIDGPTSDAHAYAVSFAGIHTGTFIEFSQLLH